MTDDEAASQGRSAPEMLFPDDAGVLAMLHESLAAGFSCVDAQGRFLRVNSGLCRMLGYSEQELLGLTFADVTHPDDHGIGQRVLQESSQGDYQTTTIEKRYIRRDGETVWVLVSPTLVRDAAGRPAWYATVTIDITARKRIELELQRSEERYRTYVDAAPDAVLVIAPDGRYVDVNVAACTLTGFTREELLAMSVTDLAAFDAPENITARLRSLAATGRLRRETFFRRKDGSRVPVELDAVTLSDGRMMAFCKDITERLAAEEEQRRIEENLRQTQKLESLGILAGGIAHDFNNLLVGVLGNAELMLKRSAPTASGYAQLQNIASAAVRAGELCQQMLAFAGQTSVERSAIDLSQAVHEMVDLLGAAISNRASVTFRLGADLPCIRADGAQIRQVIMNLITNAAESRDDEQVHIDVSTGTVQLAAADLTAAYAAHELPKGRYVYLQVADDGRGMDAPTALRMFDPFFTTKTRGHGLGLAALRGIVHAHGGAVRVDTEPGRGTTVQVIFPEPVAQEVQTSPQAPPPSGSDVRAAEWSSSGKVMVVDDEPLLRGTLRAVLESYGFEVLTAASGQEALTYAAAASGTLRCVLLDYSMPEMKGNETLARLRQLDAQVPVLVLSGYGDQGMDGAFAGLSVSGFVQKPFRIDELAARLRQTLGE